MAMFFTTKIVPLKVELKNNQQFIEQARVKQETPPDPQQWQEVTYNAKHLDDVDGIEVEVSSIEKIKAFVDSDIQLKKPIDVVVKFVPYTSNAGSASISAKIVGIL